MADYIYLLENRLSADQQNALRQLREVAREAGFLVFLTGDSVRDLTSGHAVRDLEVAVHGNALKLKKTIEKVGGKIWGEDEPSKSLFVCFPGTVRVDIISCHSVEYPKPGKAVNHPATILDDLRRRDFTVNAMAISLNEGSFGLLMDPLNGVADIETRSLRLVSNYGFLEEPSLLIRATRYQVRLGWELDPKTRTRYENAVGENVIEHLSDTARSQELEQIGHEEEGLKVLQALETAGWMKVLFPAWTSAKADAEKLTGLHDLAVELLVQGIHPDISAAQMQLLTAKLAPKDLSALKKLMLRPGFVEEWNSLDSLAAKFAKILLSKENATPSAGFKLFTSYDPEAILWLGFTTKDAAVKERFNQFLRVWPEAKQRIPHALMQEMRITPEIAIYKDVIHQIFLQLIDGKLETPEEMRAFLEPHSPPAPPPQVTIKRTRAKRSEAKVKERSFDDEEDGEEELDVDDDLGEVEGDDVDLDIGIKLPKVDLDSELEEEPEPGDDDLDDEDEEPAPKRGAKSAPPAKGSAVKVKLAPAATEAPKGKPAAAALAAPKALAPKTPAPSNPAAAQEKAAPPAKQAAAQEKATLSAKPAAKPVKPVPPAKPAAKATVKPVPKAPAKTAAKSAPQKPAHKVAKPAPKPKPVPKPKPTPKPKPKTPAKPAAKTAPAKKGSSAKIVKAARPAPKKAPVKSAKKK
jgi:tRNA nucleotidyltransferase/poly(A) polymerase